VKNATLPGSSAGRINLCAKLRAASLISSDAGTPSVTITALTK